MASHHHLHHHRNTTTSCCCCDCSSPHCTPLNHPAKPPSTEPLLQAILSHLLQQQQQEGRQSHYQPQTHKTHQKHHFRQQGQHFQQDQQAKFVLSSLVSRIDALETSLHNFSLSTTVRSQYSSSCSLRDVAARVIQTHFRAFLVRRSRTLRQLKELAVIKSSFNSLKLSVSRKTHFDFHVISHKAMDLLLKLDSIQGDDPMIRDGKRSISMNLVKFLEFVDEFAVKRREISSKAVKNVRFVGKSNKSRFLMSNQGDLGKDKSEITEKLRDRIEKIRGFSRVSKSEDEDVELEGFQQLIDDDDDDDDDDEKEDPRISRNRNGAFVKRHVVAQPRVKKSVSFAENGNVYRIFSNDNINEPNSSGDGTLTDDSGSSDDNGLVVENLCNEVEETKVLSEVTEDGEEVWLENGESLQSSDGERINLRSLRSEDINEVNGDYKGQDGRFVFSAPLPVKMESRADLMKKRKAVKFVT